MASMHKLIVSLWNIATKKDSKTSDAKLPYMGCATTDNFCFSSEFCLSIG